MAVVNGNGGSNFLFGTFGNDQINGRGGSDVLFGLFGNDAIRGGGGNDWMFGGWGNDRIHGGNGDDVGFGGAGNDRIHGGNGDDFGFGGSGNDRLIGGRGSDTMFGGSGNDTFVYRAERNVGEVDYYSGGSGNDRLVLRLNADEAANTDVQADIAAFEAFLDQGGFGDFTFSSLGLTVNGIERLTVRAPDPVEPTNNAPVVGAPVDLGSGNENTSFFVIKDELLTGASDADNDPLILSNLTVSSGNASIEFVDGGYLVTPAADDQSAVTLSYTITDGQGGSVEQTATLDLLPTNSAPTVSESVDLGAIDEDTIRNITFGELFAGASDADDDPLSITDATISSGDAQLAFLFFEGSEISSDTLAFRVTPDDDYYGEVTLTYTISDGQGGSVVQTATLDVTPVNDAPVTPDIELTVGEDGSVSVIPPIFVSDADFDVLSYTYDFGETIGSVTEGGDFSLVYSPGEPFNGLDDGETASDSFTYSAFDGQETSTGTVFVTIEGENDAPVVYDDNFSAEIESPTPGVLVTRSGFTFDVLENDFDPDGDTLQITDVESRFGVNVMVVQGADGGDEIYAEAVGGPQGELDGPLGFIRRIDLDYTVSDGDLSETATLSFDILDYFVVG